MKGINCSWRKNFMYIVGMLNTLVIKGLVVMKGLVLVISIPLFLYGLYVYDHDEQRVKSDQQSNHHIGIDISHYQGNLMDEIKGHDYLDFVICKATQGITYTDEDFDKNWRLIKEKGLIRGAYHFFVVSDDPEDQAKHFYDTVPDLGIEDIAPIVDVEELSLSQDTSSRVLQDRLKEFLMVVEEKFGRRPMIYSNYAFAQEYLKDDWLADYPLWIADYNGKSSPAIPNTWVDVGYKIWQKNNSYHVDSIATDFDVFIGQKSDLVR